MAKKKESKTTKARQAGAVKPVRGDGRAKKRPAATEGATPAAPRERERDPRLPPPGTVLQKCARDKSVRCECTVEADGIRYADKLYRSLSGAAMAAAKDLGLSNKTANGWNFWGITKPARHAGEPLAALERAWDRYRERATSVVGAVTDVNREQVRDAIEKHAEAIKDLHRKVG